MNGVSPAKPLPHRTTVLWTFGAPEIANRYIKDFDLLLVALNLLEGADLKKSFLFSRAS